MFLKRIGYWAKWAISRYSGRMGIGERVPQPNSVSEICRSYKRPVLPYERFTGCRAMLFDSTLKEVVMIRRIKQGMTPYYVLPGGGMDTNDATPQDCLWRELHEELGISRNLAYIDSEHALIIDGKEPGEEQAVFAGVIDRNTPLSLGGPELERSLSGDNLYQPMWVPLANLEAYDIRPQELTGMLIQCVADTSLRQ